MTQLEKDMLKIRDIMTYFDYNDINLTEEQLKVIEEIKDIVYKDEYDYLCDLYIKETNPEEWEKLKSEGSEKLRNFIKGGIKNVK